MTFIRNLLTGASASDENVPLFTGDDLAEVIKPAPGWLELNREKVDKYLGVLSERIAAKEIEIITAQSELAEMKQTERAYVAAMKILYEENNTPLDKYTLADGGANIKTKHVNIVDNDG